MIFQRVIKNVSLNILRFNLIYICLFPIFFIFSDVRVIIDNSISSMLFAVYVSIFVVGVLSLWVNYSLSKNNYEHFRKIWKKRNFILMPCVYALCLIPATFCALPNLLHFFYANEGTIELTVEAKIVKRSRYRCAPRIEVKELTYIGNIGKNFICVPNLAFDNLDLNNKVLGYGQISPFGIDVSISR